MKAPVLDLRFATKLSSPTKVLFGLRIIRLVVAPLFMWGSQKTKSLVPMIHKIAWQKTFSLSLSHHGGDLVRLAQYQRVNELQVKLWAEFLAKMHAANEGERSLLQNSMVLLTSSLMDGNVHDSTQLPVVLAGGGGGAIRGGRHFDLGKDTNRKLCRLHLALMDRMGLRVERFGDAENALNI